MEVKQPERLRFTSNQVWNNFLKTLQPNSEIDLISLRRACYNDIQNLRGRPLLVFASRFVNPIPAPIPIPNSIEINDIDGFTDLVSSVPENIKSIDILLHSPGGKPDATERLVHLLRARFDEVHFLVPHSAYSAATMLALSGDTIV